MEKQIKGRIIESLPNTTFRVELEDKSVVLAYVSGKMRMNRIKVLMGDMVELVVDDYGEKGRIVKRI